MAKGIKRTNEEYIKEVNVVHNNKYNYNKTIYSGSKNHIIIGCDIHGDFTKNARKHLEGRGCLICKEEERRKNQFNIFLENAKYIHNDYYGYENIDYIKNSLKIDITCPKHGTFKQTPNKHLCGRGCSECANNILKTNETFLKECMSLYFGEYQYLTKYRASDKPIEIFCEKHGIFSKTPNAHITQNQGCPRCKSSKGEKKIMKYLEKNNIVYESEFKFPGLKSNKNKHLRFDFYLPEQNICIEYDGIQHYKIIEHFGGRSGFMKTKHRDGLKNKYCDDNNIGLIRIPYTDFNNIGLIIENKI